MAMLPLRAGPALEAEAGDGFFFSEMLTSASLEKSVSELRSLADFLDSRSRTSSMLDSSVSSLNNNSDFVT